MRRPTRWYGWAGAAGAIVCTIEKANQVVGRMMEEGSLGDLGAIIIDELHMVADDDRWALSIPSCFLSSWVGTSTSC